MYNKSDDNIQASVDWIVVLLYFTMVICGWLNVYAASYQFEQTVGIFDLSGRAGMQLVWIGTSSILAFILLKLDSSMYDVFAYLIYTFFIGLLIVTIFVAPDIKGSRSWLVITDTIRLQPAEFTKFAVALALARLFNSYNFKLMLPKNLFVVASIIVLPMILILLQKETGSALVYIAFVLVLYREGLPGMVLVSGLCAILFFVVGMKYSETDLGFITEGELICSILIILITAGLIVNFRKDWDAARMIIIGIFVIFGVGYLISLFTTMYWGIVVAVAIVALFIYLFILARKHWSKNYLFIAGFAVCSLVFVSSSHYVFSDVLQPHQQERIKVTLGMKDDLKGAEYNVNQSKIAIGSGGFIGKGFLNGTQTKLKYVPEQDTDFIFCTIGEEWGFIGSTLVVLMFLALITRLIYLAERQKNTFGRVYGYSVASILLFHIFINIGMVIGITPVIGIPLPFFSYGGSSLWGFTILLFIFLRIDMTRKRR